MKKKNQKSLITRLGIFDRYNLAFFLSSIIPLSVLVYVMHRFVLPALENSKSGHLALSLTILLYFVVFLSILAFFVSRSVTREFVDKLQVNNTKLKNVFVIAEALGRESYLDVLIDTVVKRAVELTDASAGIALIWDEDSGELVFEVAQGTGSLDVRSVAADTGVAGWVFKHQKVALIDDVSVDDRYNPEKNVLPGFETGSILAVPLVSRGKVFGVIELLNRKDRPGFKQDDADLLKCLAGQASIFIHNVYYREEQQNYFTHVTGLLLTVLEGTRQIWPGHLSNSARYAYLIAKHYGLTDADLKKIHYAALLHDIGFVKLDLKDGQHRQQIELHPDIGYEMIRPISLWRDVAPIIRHHHERFDGNGYPMKLAKNDIPIGARILSVAETLDVLCNPMSYKKTNLSLNDAIQEIRAYSGTQFDPDVVDIVDELFKNGTLS